MTNEDEETRTDEAQNVCSIARAGYAHGGSGLWYACTLATATPALSPNPVCEEPIALTAIVCSQDG